MRQAHEMLPDVHLHTNSNGDYLKPEYVAELYDAGLRSISVQAYLKSRTYTEEEATRLIEKIKPRLGIPLKLKIHDPGQWIEYRGNYRDMAVRLYARNFEEGGTDRGGLVDIGHEHSRTSPCLSPFNHMYVDFDGSVMPCCNLRSDAPEHAGYVIDRLDGTADALFRAYASSNAAGWRKHLIRFSAKSKPCDTCRFSELDAAPRLVRQLDSAWGSVGD
jgi:MoaA/NifB/PqqE/SkfB family radical SAM enzyme